MPHLNSTVLMSGTEHFSDEFAINAYMDSSVPVDSDRAAAEHINIRHALESAGVTVIQVPAPEHCQDGVYTANWALVGGEVAVMSNLPNKRQAEQPYAEKILRELGKTIIHLPTSIRFSGQGDALRCGKYLFAGTSYRTDAAAHDFVADIFGYGVVSLQTIPALDNNGTPIINAETGWPESFFYDIDLAISVLKSDLIAWCPEAFTAESQEKIRALTDLQKIEVSLEEAQQGFACNLVSTGETVIMSNRAPQLQAAIEAHGLKTLPQDVVELGKGGGFIRCTTLTLYN
ncbi:dimethylarginine dimethylaminohydrolase family protein [Methyloglobulus sp.]|uniref:dimethylarginine dimethylaminohydrolase family protein n=1 Tax=Methyloglobulus sp. TaxID=2518622 RepID=UPI00398A35D3